jgi:hypothetical protein
MPHLSGRSAHMNEWRVSDNEMLCVNVWMWVSSQPQTGPAASDPERIVTYIGRASRSRPFYHFAAVLSFNRAPGVKTWRHR